VVFRDGAGSTFIVSCSRAIAENHVQRAGTTLWAGELFALQQGLDSGDTCQWVTAQAILNEPDRHVPA